MRNTSQSMGASQNDTIMEHWLRQQVVPAYDAMQADPSRGRSAAELRAMLATEHEKTTIASPRARGSVPAGG